MGGDDSFSIVSSLDDHSSLDDDFRCSDDLGLKLEDEVAKSHSGFDSGEFDQGGLHGNSSNDVEFTDNLRRRLRLNAYREIMQSYCDPSARIESLSEAKRIVLSYTPGSWIDKEDGLKLSDYDVPNTTTLLLVGPKGSGKSSLINRVSRVFEDNKLASDRAQVSYNSSTRDGTYFLQGYMIPRQSNSFCLFDTRSLSDDLYDNGDMLQSWMTEGVCHGELVIRDSDDSSLRTMLKCKIRDSNTISAPVKVNFVIVVVDGLSVLRYMNGNKEEDTWHAEMLARTLNFPYISFKDDKPAIVVTHGDLLSLEERARVRIYLGEQLGVPPTTQIFDIPESSDPLTELAILDMLKYSLEHADKNLPRKSWVCRKLCPTKSSLQQVFQSYFFALLFLGLALGMNVAMERQLIAGVRAPWLYSPFHHHQFKLNQTLDHLDKPQFNSTNQSMNQTLNHPNQTQLNTTSQPNSSHEPSLTTRENNQPGKLQQLNSTIQSTSSHAHHHNEPPSTTGDCDRPSKLQDPSMQSQKATNEPCRSPEKPNSRSAKHEQMDHEHPSTTRESNLQDPSTPSPKATNEPRRRQEKPKSGSAKYKQMDHEPPSTTRYSNLQGKPKSGSAKHKQMDHQLENTKKIRSSQQNEDVEPEINWEARKRLWLGH